MAINVNGLNSYMKGKDFLKVFKKIKILITGTYTQRCIMVINERMDKDRSGKQKQKIKRE